MQYKASWSLKILLTNQHPFLLEHIRAEKNNLSKPEELSVISMNRSFSDGIILIMRRSMELNSASMMKYRLRFKKLGVVQTRHNSAKANRWYAFNTQICR